MDSRKAVHTYHRNLAMVVGLILLMFLLIPAMVKSPYILNIFVKEINEEFKAEYGVDMNGHSAESYTVVWLFKAAIEAAGSTDGAAVKDALANLEINGEFPGGRKIVLPYDKVKFENYDLAGEAHYRDNTSASVAIAQIQDGQWKTVWPFDFSDTKIAYPAPLQ